VKLGLYRLAGLRILSDLPLFGIQTCPDETVQDNEVRIRRSIISDDLASTTARFRDGQHIRGCNGKEVLLEFPRVGRFLVRGGNEILVDLLPACDDGEVRAYLLGTAFGVLCHQRGITPLHASAIDFGGGGVAFVGASGAGKSTLIAALARRGHKVIADDVCFLQFDGEGNIQAQPGVERIRLWEEAMYALGYDRCGVEREMHGYNKYFIPIPPARGPVGRRHLHRVYELQASVDGAIALDRLQGARAIEVLMQNVYRLGLAERLGYKPHAFTVCASVARNVPIFRLNRPKHFNALEDTIQALEDHLHEMR